MATIDQLEEEINSIKARNKRAQSSKLQIVKIGTLFLFVGIFIIGFNKNKQYSFLLKSFRPGYFKRSCLVCYHYFEVSFFQLGFVIWVDES